MHTGTLAAIWIKRSRGGPMDPAAQATLETGRGITGNADQGGRRQVTIIEREEWERLMAEVGGSLDPSARRANFMVTGLDLRESRNRLLAIGGCRIRILGETKPCNQMDEAFLGLKEAMYPDWGGGVYGEVISGGTVSVGDPVHWIQEPGATETPPVAGP